MKPNTKCLDVKVPCTVKDSLRETQLGQLERYQRLVIKARAQFDETQDKTNDEHNTAMLEQQDQLAQHAKTLEDTKRRPRHLPQQGQPITNKKRRVKTTIESVSG